MLTCKPRYAVTVIMVLWQHVSMPQSLHTLVQVLAFGSADLSWHDPVPECLALSVSIPFKTRTFEPEGVRNQGRRVRRGSWYQVADPPVLKTASL